MSSLKRSEEKFVLLFENAPIGMAMISHDTGEFLEVNKALLSYVGYTKDEFLKLTFWDITPTEYASQEQSQIDELNRSGRFGPNEKEYVRRDGTRVPIRLSGFKLIDVDDREVVWGIIENITLEKELKAQHEKLKRLSVTDHLTGLFNRQKLEQTLATEIDRASRANSCFGVIMLDLDFFKRVNDTYGHQVGDEILIEVSNVLRQRSRRTDIVGRWGGEEFMIICPATDLQGAQRLAELIRTKIEQHAFPVVGEQTCSLGVSCHQQAEDARSTIQRVDQALYQAKQQGRNCVVSV
jgi:diguanylate cyclase (GGDEF)-like protein/PAS domain S-box-containing protein